MFDLKARLLDQARATASSKNEQFSLEHYRKASEAFAATEQGQKMVADKQWNPAIYADLSGQNLDGIRLSDPKVAVAEPTHLSKPTNADYDSFDRDGDGKINSPAVSSFYDNIRLDGASLREAFVEPATSFNVEVATAKDLKGITFSGMNDGDHFTFGANAHYQDVRLENVHGGQITFNGTVEGVSISGKSASIAIGDHARVSDVQTSDGFSIIHLDMGAGAVVSNADLSKATISMTSHFEAGAVLQNVQLSSNLNGLDLSGVKLFNVAIDGNAITHPSQLPESVTFDARTTVSASPEFVREHSPETALPSTGRLPVADTTLNAALSGAYNPAKDITARLQPEVTVAHSLPSSNA